MKLSMLAIILQICLASICGIAVVSGYYLLVDSIKSQVFKETVVYYSPEGLTKEPVHIL